MCLFLWICGFACSSLISFPPFLRFFRMVLGMSMLLECILFLRILLLVLIFSLNLRHKSSIRSSNVLILLMSVFNKSFSCTLISVNSFKSNSGGIIDSIADSDCCVSGSPIISSGCTAGSSLMDLRGFLLSIWNISSNISSNLFSSYGSLTYTLFRAVFIFEISVSFLNKSHT